MSSDGVNSNADEPFKPIGPRPLDQKVKPYKFIEPPGIFEWMFSFAKKCLVASVLYSFGYYRISVGWLVGPVILMVVRDQWRRHHDAQRAFAKAAAKDEREIVLARLGDNLPSWVTFPDVERAEWLNEMILQLWPRINHFAYDLVVQTIEPALRENLAQNYKMGSFRFEKIILGDTPLRIRGVKVYDAKKTDRNEIIMDLDVIYCGDCDFRFSVAKIRAGIKDMQLSGILRLVMKPLIKQIPLVGGVEYFFLNPPSLDFNLIGMADVFDMPGLSDLLRRIVQEQICNMCVLPNKMFIKLAEDVDQQGVCSSKPEGIIRVCAIEARNLLKKDIGILGTGKSDPYIILSVGAQQHKSKIINNTVNPKWEFYCEMLVEEIGQNLNLILYDHDDAPRADEFLGRATVDLTMVRREGTVDLWLDLEDVKKGQVHLKLTWLNLSENPADLKSALIESQSFVGLNSALVSVRLDSAKNLPSVMKRKTTMGVGTGKLKSQVSTSGSRPDPYAVLSVGKQTRETVTLQKTADPVFEEYFHFLVRNPLTDVLLVRLIDRKTGTELGALKQSLDVVFHRPDMKMEKQNISLITAILNSSDDAKIVLDMELKVLKPGAAKDTEHDDEQLFYPSPNKPSTSHINNDELQKQQEAAAKVKEGLEDHPRNSDSISKSSTLNIDDKSVDEPFFKMDEIPEESSNVLRHRGSSATVTASESDMKIKLSLFYNQTNQQLLVDVHSLANLPILETDTGELPDPYVKLYVLPDKVKKHKTQVHKDDCNPIYDERFEFPVVDLRGKTLHIQVCDKKKFFKASPKMGEAFIVLEDEFLNLSNAKYTNWFALIQ